MSTKRNIIITSTGCGLIAAAIVAFVIYPLVQDIKKSSQELVTVRNEAAVFQEGTGRIDYLKERYDELQPTFAKFDSLFINPEAPIDVITFWEQTAGDEGIAITIVPAQLKAAEDEPWDALSFQIRATGSFSKFLRFLEKIETGPHLIQTVNVTIKRLTKNDLQLKQYEQFSQGDVNTTLLVRVFTE